MREGREERKDGRIKGGREAESMHSFWKFFSLLSLVILG